jgi:primosomal protein N' (replication factor Y)
VTSAAPSPSDALAEAPVYCDVSLPVPIDTAFTYRLPETLRRCVQPGCRVLVPFGSRKLTGVVLATHSQPPTGPAKEALRLLDQEPALDQGLLDLGRWISTY